MPLQSSHVIDVLQRVRSVLLDELSHRIPGLDIEIDNPARTPTGSTPNLSIFLYRVERRTGATVPTRGLPTVLALHILITSYSPPVTDDDGDTRGIAELKMLALAARVFGGELDLGVVPLVDAPEIGILAQMDPQNLRARISLENLENEDINHIWMTQTDTPYRTSLGYVIHFGLLTPFHPTLEGPQILAVEHDLSPFDSAGTLPAPGDTAKPVPMPRVDTVSGSMMVIDKLGRLKAALSFDYDEGEVAPIPLKLLAVAAEAATLDLAVEVLQAGGTWTAAPGGALNIAQMPAIAHGELGTDLDAASSDATLTPAADAIAYRISAAPQGGAPTPVFPPVTVVLNRPVEDS